MRSHGIAAGLLLASAFLSGCASDPPAPQRRGEPPAGQDGGSGRASAIFISPAGEPFREGAGPPMRRWFDQADADHDGVLTDAEFQADQLRFFDVVDLNHDGVLTPPEVRNYEDRIAPEILSANDRPDLDVREAPEPGDIRRIPGGRGGGMPDSPGGPGRRSGHGSPGGRGQGGAEAGEPSARMTGSGFSQARQGAARYSLVNEPEPLRAADADYDFKITRAEWVAASSRRFTLIDADHDGRIAYAELRAPNGGRGGRGRSRGRP